MCVENAVFSPGRQGAGRSGQAAATPPVPGEQDLESGNVGAAKQGLWGSELWKCRALMAFDQEGGKIGQNFPLCGI